MAVLPSVAHAEEPAYFAAPAPPPPQPPIVIGAHTCFVGEHVGIDDADAHTTTDLVCSELAPHGAPAGAYEVRFGKLGTHLLVGVSERATRTYRRILVNSLDEIPVAAPRLVAALVLQKSMDETQNVDNVVSSESHTPRSKALAVSVELSLVGLSGVGVAPNTSAGGEVGVMLRSRRLSLGPWFRAGGAGSGSNKVTFVGVGAGARYHFGDGDTAAFVGGGVAISYMMVNRDPVTGPVDKSIPYESYYGGSADLSPSGSGFGSYLEVGLELLRTSKAGAIFSLRADAPFYAVTYDGTLGTYPAEPVHVARYVVPLSLNVGIRFH